MHETEIDLGWILSEGKYMCALSREESINFSPMLIEPTHTEDVANKSVSFPERAVKNPRDANADNFGKYIDTRDI